MQATKGFTLLEMLVALVLSVLIMAALGGVLKQVEQSWRRLGFVLFGPEVWQTQAEHLSQRFYTAWLYPLYDDRSVFFDGQAQQVFWVSRITGVQPGQAVDSPVQEAPWLYGLRIQENGQQMHLQIARAPVYTQGSPELLAEDALWTEILAAHQIELAYWIEENTQLNLPPALLSAWHAGQYPRLPDAVRLRYRLEANAPWQTWWFPLGERHTGITQSAEPSR